MNKSSPKSHKARPQRQKGRRGTSAAGPNKTLIWGIHAVAAALANPVRQKKSLFLTRNAAKRIEDILSQPLPPFEDASPQDIARKINTDAVHQGALLHTEELAPGLLEDLPGHDCVAVLDQVTDPHNVGAILRSAAAFGISSLIMQQRHSPPLSGALAKTACGGLEHVTVIQVSNLAQAMVKLGKLGYERIGFDGSGPESMEGFGRAPSRGLALVFGAEENGLRRLTREHCDHLCRITADGAFCSLNVSNAAAVAFHHFLTRSK